MIFGIPVNLFTNLQPALRYSFNTTVMRTMFSSVSIVYGLSLVYRRDERGTAEVVVLGLEPQIRSGTWPSPPGLT